MIDASATKTKALARVEDRSAAESLPAIGSRAHTDLVKKQIMPDASDLELELFLTFCQRAQLDPLSRQVFAVKRWDSSRRTEVWSFQISIDGYRLIAQRTRKYRGQTKQEWCGQDGIWKDVWLSDEPPSAARIGVYRAGCLEPIYAVARFSAYAQRKKDGSLTPMWEKMPDLMLSKVAEALALRKAFPQELSGVYTDDEMDQEDAPAPKPIEAKPRQEPRAAPESVTYEPDSEGILSAQATMIEAKSVVTETSAATPRDFWQAVNRAKLNRAGALRILSENFGAQDPRELTGEAIAEAVDLILQGAKEAS